MSIDVRVLLVSVPSSVTPALQRRTRLHPPLLMDLLPPAQHPRPPTTRNPLLPPHSWWTPPLWLCPNRLLRYLKTNRIHKLSH
ncbi:hypothetical protein GDO81_023080 [Engystomops pustulosus]|uniref:Uncharacterized protein n=1 Tax=Engystomops pustulosus TaxID=76066 RepID=A0AAV6YW79_ENGPU|nr:hypothetical protein GDO81_023080 [Engystomops pustulosus]